MKIKILNIAYGLTMAQSMLLFIALVNAYFSNIKPMYVYGIFTIVAGVVNIIAYLVIDKPRSRGALIMTIGFILSNLILAINRSVFVSLAVIGLVLIVNIVGLVFYTLEIRKSKADIIV